MARQDIPFEALNDELLDIHVGSWCAANGQRRRVWERKGIGSQGGHRNAAQRPETRQRKPEAGTAHPSIDSAPFVVAIVDSAESAGVVDSGVWTVLLNGGVDASRAQKGTEMLRLGARARYTSGAGQQIRVHSMWCRYHVEQCTSRRASFKVESRDSNICQRSALHLGIESKTRKWG